MFNCTTAVQIASLLAAATVMFNYTSEFVSLHTAVKSLFCSERSRSDRYVQTIAGVKDVRNQDVDT